MKKKIFSMAVIVICLAVLASGTAAYFTTEDTARNVITTGTVQATVVEEQLVNGTLQPYPDEPIEIMPGQTVSKIVSVRSDGAAIWVRAKFTTEVFDAQGKKMDIPAEELKKVIQIPTNSTEWTQAGDWWYFGTALQAGESTVPLFEEVRFSGPHMDNKYQNCTVEILVTAQAVQAANNGTTVEEATGWPEA